MNKKKIFDSVVASALSVAMVLSIILSAIFLMPSTTTQAATVEGNNFDFKFKKSNGSNVAISFIGDSITTYSDFSNNTAYNSTIGGNAVYYGKTTHAHYSEFSEVKASDTWWMQTIDTLGLELCVNNSWSGSKIINMSGNVSQAIGSQGNAGYYTRCQNLHNDKTGKKPDIVVVFLGTNDIGSRESTTNMYGVRTLSAVDSKYTDAAWVPGTVVGAYAGMIRRICAAYPEAEVYCCTVLPQLDERLSNNKASYDIFYKGVQEVVNGYNTGKWTDQSGNTGTCYKHTPGVYMVDFYNESGIHQDKQSRENCYANRLHPNKKGMDAMSNLLISELMEHSQYMPSETVDVTYDLANAFVEVGNVTATGQTMYGDVTRAVKGKPFQVKINTKGTPNIDYRVTMGGEDITDSVVAGNTITIPYVTGDIAIRAHEFDYFYWGAGLGGLESFHDTDTRANANALNCFYDDGAYSVIDNAANFDSSGRAYKMSEPINLLHDRNWELEFRMSGTFSSGALLLSYSPTSDVWDIDTVNGATRGYVKENNVHIFRTGTNGMLAFGVTTERDNDKTTSSGSYADYYYHYGVGLTNASYGGTSGFDVSAMHTYRMFNVYNRASDSNTIYLSIDGGTPVAMTYSATANTFGGTGSTSTYEMSGRDLTFNSIGTWDGDRQNGGNAYGHPLRNCRIEYIKVRENGNTVTYNHDPSNYYWEFNSSFESNPEANPIFADNQGTVAYGAYVANGVFADTAKASIKLDTPVVLKSSLPWILEYQSWGVNAGGILLTSDTSASNMFGNTYIHINQSSVLFGYANKSNGNGYTNSGFNYTDIATKLGSSSGQEIRKELHKYTLQNVVYPDGTNVVQLYVDDVLIGDMFSRTSNWAGIDLVINYFGTTNHPLQNIDMDYILIYENGIPEVEVDEEINNFRWDATKNGMTTVEASAYFTKNPATIMSGSGVNGVHDLPSHYQLDQSVNLLHDRDWNIEWRASGSWGGTDNSGNDPMLLSSTGTRKKNMTYIWRNANDMICFGHYNSSGYHNYGIKLTNTEFGEPNDGQIYTYRLENRITRDEAGNYITNMVYLWIDGVEIGAMDNYFINHDDQNQKDEWLAGKDFTFNYFGNDVFTWLDVDFEYLQIWEDGYKFDDSQLRYLLLNWDIGRDLEFNYHHPNYSAYVRAYNAAKAVLTQVDATQADIDKAFEDFMKANNALVITTLETNTIYSVELVTGEYARVGKQVGLKVITSPDIAQVCVGNQTLLTNTAQLQKMTIDGEEKTVKVWLVSFNYGSDESYDGKSVTFGVGAWTTYDASHKGTSSSNPDAHMSIKVPFRSYFATRIEIENLPDNVYYGYKDEFDTTGMVVRAYYNNGETAVLSSDEYNILNPILYPGDEFVTIEYQGATAQVEVFVIAEVSQATWWASDVNDPDATEPPVIWVQGAFIGCVANDDSSIYEALVKDLHSDLIIGVQFDTYDDMIGNFDGYGIGDPVWVKGQVYTDSVNFNKTYMMNAFAQYPDIEVDTSEFTLESNSQIGVHHQQQLSDWFQTGSINAYRYVEFKGTMYLHRYNPNGEVYYTIHFNPDAADWGEMGGYDTGEVVQFTENRLYLDQGNDPILESLYWEASEEFNMNFEDTGMDFFPGIKLEGTIRGVFAYYDGAYQMTILDSSWVDVTVTDVTVEDAEIIE